MSEANLKRGWTRRGVFRRPEEFAKQANAQPSIYAEADADPVAYWRQQAERLTWTKSPTKTLEWDLPFAKWFSDGTLNASYNCVDRHVEAGKGDKVAYHWVADAEGESRTITYGELQKMVAKAANALTELGVKQGDRVAVYMPMIPEAIVTMLAIVRLGAVHSVIFAGFSADSLSSRILDSDCQVVVTADGAFRRGAASAAEARGRRGLEELPNVRAVLGGSAHGGRRRVDRRSRPLVARTRRPAERHARATSPSTPRTRCSSCTPREPPRSPRASSTRPGGYLTQAATTYYNIFDVKPDTDVCWTAADIGWITGHSYIVYGPLINGVTSVMYEGLPDSGGRDRWWKIIEENKVSILYTAPTTIRTLDEVGPRTSRAVTTCRACACSVRWASPSIPRLGCGTASTLAATAARSWTRGGRPRPAPS